MKESIVSRLKIFAAIFLILGIVFIGLGFYKMFVYENSEYSWGERKNVYVGGDAYNYIINGTYFDGYVTLGGSMLICATICEVSGLKIKTRAEDDRIHKNSLTESPKNNRAAIFRDEERPIW